MTNDDDMIIRKAAREICAGRYGVSTLYKELYLDGTFDGAEHMRLVEQGIRKGIEIGRSM